MVRKLNLIFDLIIILFIFIKTKLMYSTEILVFDGLIPVFLNFCS